MPLYEYRAAGKKSCSACVDRLEVFQKMSDAALEKCPQCGAKITKLLSSPTIHGAGSNVLSNKNLGEKGFTKYVKAGDGFYEKKAGKGPDVIRR